MYVYPAANLRDDRGLTIKPFDEWNSYGIDDNAYTAGDGILIKEILKFNFQSEYVCEWS